VKAGIEQCGPALAVLIETVALAYELDVDELIDGIRNTIANQGLEQ
jgi:hypothetical protein